MHCGCDAVAFGVHSDFVHKFQAIITSSDGRIFSAVSCLVRLM
jgi:hypothetical protein